MGQSEPEQSDRLLRVRWALVYLAIVVMVLEFLSMVVWW
jgi:hypothetical protein